MASPCCRHCRYNKLKWGNFSVLFLWWWAFLFVCLFQLTFSLITLSQLPVTVSQSFRHSVTEWDFSSIHALIVGFRKILIVCLRAKSLQIKINFLSTKQMKKSSINAAVVKIKLIFVCFNGLLLICHVSCFIKYQLKFFAKQHVAKLFFESQFVN